MITHKHKDERLTALVKPVNILTRDVETIVSENRAGENVQWSLVRSASFKCAELKATHVY